MSKSWQRLHVVQCPPLPDRAPDTGRICNEKRQASAAQAQVERVAGDGQHVALAGALVAGAVVMDGFGSWFHHLISAFCPGRLSFL